MYGYQKVFERGLEGHDEFFRTQGFPLPGVFALVASYLELLWWLSRSLSVSRCAGLPCSFASRCS